MLNTAANKRFDLSLTAYEGGILRVLVDEPGAGRYAIDDIVQSGLQNTPWQVASQSAVTTVLSAGNATVTLQHAPFRLELEVNGKLAQVINSRDMFNVEHTRSKEVRGRGRCVTCDVLISASIAAAAAAAGFCCI
jgi:hypothetical protein